MISVIGLSMFSVIAKVENNNIEFLEMSSRNDHIRWTKHLCLAYMVNGGGYAQSFGRSLGLDLGHIPFVEYGMLEDVYRALVRASNEVNEIIDRNSSGLTIQAPKEPESRRILEL